MPEAFERHEISEHITISAFYAMDYTIAIQYTIFANINMATKLMFINFSPNFNAMN